MKQSSKGKQYIASKGNYIMLIKQVLYKMNEKVNGNEVSSKIPEE